MATSTADLVVNAAVPAGTVQATADLVVAAEQQAGAVRASADLTVHALVPGGARATADLSVFAQASTPLYRMTNGTLQPARFWYRRAGAWVAASLFRRVNGQWLPQPSTAGLSPTTVTSTTGSGQVLITWTGVTGANGYKTTRNGTGSTGLGPQEFTETSAARQRLFTNLTNGTAYTFSVQPLPGGPISVVTATPEAAGQLDVVKPLIGTAGGGINERFNPLNAQIGPMLIRRAYNSTLPSSWANSEGGTADVNAGRVTHWSWKPAMTFTTSSTQQAAFSAFLDTIPANHKVMIVCHHEPENSLDSFGGTATAGIAAWAAMQGVVADLVHQKNRPNLTFGPCFMGLWTVDTRSPNYAAWIAAWTDGTIPWAKFDFVGIDPYREKNAGGFSMQTMCTVNNSGGGSGGSAPSLFARLLPFDIPIVFSEWGYYQKALNTDGTRTPIPESEVARWILETYAWFKAWNAQNPPRIENGRERGSHIKAALYYDYTILNPPADTPLTGQEITAYGQIVADSKIGSGGVAPVASFTATPTTGYTPLSVTFTSTSTGNPTAFLWTFSDGTTSTATNPVKTFTTGIHTVTLRATNQYGSSTATRVDLITVTAQPTINVTATVNGATSAVLTWTAVAGSTGYLVGRNGTDSGGSGPWSTVDPPTVFSRQFNLLVPGQTYTLSATAQPSGATASANVLIPTTPPPVEPPPAGGTAAARFNWGTPTWSDDFNSGVISSAKWTNAPVAGMPGHDGNGRRIASSSTIVSGVLTLHGYPNGDTGWIRQNLPTRYGRWEIRVKSHNIGSSGGLYHVLALIWPTSEQWPAGGEYDWLENVDPNQQKVGAFLHYPHPNLPVQQEYFEKTGVNMNDWHHIAFEWTSAGLKGWVDGQDWYSVSGGANASRSNIQDMAQGYLTLQLDNFTGNSGLREAVMEVDYVNFWSV